MTDNTHGTEFAFGFDTELKDAPPFLGLITIDTYEPGDYGPQWHLGIRMVEAADPEKAVRHTWFPPSDQRNSKMGAFIAAAKRGNDGEPVFPELNGIKFGQGKLIGTVAWFIPKDLPIGKDKATGEMRYSRGVLLPHKQATPEEIARANTGPAEAPAALAFEPEEVSALIDFMSGKTVAELRTTTAKSPLSKACKQAILGGAALNYLTENGLVELTSEGVIQALSHA